MRSERETSIRRKKAEDHLFEVVDVGDSLGQGGLELVEVLLDGGAVTISSVAGSLGGLGVGLAVVDIASKVVRVTRADHTGVTAGGEVGLDARVLLGVPVLGSPLELGLGLGLTLEDIVEGLLRSENSVALATLGKALGPEDIGVLLLDQVKATLGLGADHARVATEALVGLDPRLRNGRASTNHARVATEALVGLDLGLGLGVGVTLEDSVDGGGQSVIDLREGATSLVADHAGVATEALVGLDLGLSAGESVGDGLSSTLGLRADHARVATETLVGLDLGLGLSEGAGREDHNGEDSGGDLHVDGLVLWIFGVWFGLELEEDVVVL